MGGVFSDKDKIRDQIRGKLIYILIEKVIIE